MPAHAPSTISEVEHEELVVELDALLVALLEERLQDHVPGAVGRVAGSLDRRLTVVARVAPEAPLVDLALRGAVEGKAHPLELEDRVDRLLAHDVDRVLIGEEVATLDGVEGVPLPRVLFDVRERGAHPALRGSGVRPGRVELGDDGGLASLAGFERRPQPGAAGADDDGVVRVVLSHQRPPIAGRRSR